MALFSFLSALITRVLFLLVSLVAVWRVTFVKKDPYYWFLLFLFLPLFLELIITLKSQKGKDYKWFSPTILLFLVCIIPSIWILELHHQENKILDDQCKYNNSWEKLGAVFRNISYDPDQLGGSIKHFRDVFFSFCQKNWVLGLHQCVLILLIIGKWFLPLGDGVTRDQLSQLLLIFVSTAADILEFTSETLDDVKDSNPELVYITLAVWSWSMLQFPFHLCVVKTMGEGEEATHGDSLWSRHSTDLWSIVETVFIHDGPFLVVRLTVMIKYMIFHQMLIFFTFKNFLVLILNLYRLAVICQGYKSSRCPPKEIRGEQGIQSETDEG